MFASDPIVVMIPRNELFIKEFRLLQIPEIIRAQQIIILLYFST